VKSHQPDCSAQNKNKTNKVRSQKKKKTNANNNQCKLLFCKKTLFCAKQKQNKQSALAKKKQIQTTINANYCSAKKNPTTTKQNKQTIVLQKKNPTTTKENKQTIAVRNNQKAKQVKCAQKQNKYKQQSMQTKIKINTNTFHCFFPEEHLGFVKWQHKHFSVRAIFVARTQFFAAHVHNPSKHDGVLILVLVETRHDVSLADILFTFTAMQMSCAKPTSAMQGKRKFV
jgi:acetyl/propionyl-CoA carboxylase alpha subunit